MQLQLNMMMMLVIAKREMRHALQTQFETGRLDRIMEGSAGGERRVRTAR